LSKWKKVLLGLFWVGLLVICLAHYGIGTDTVKGETLNEEKMCKAIYHAEGINSRFPYGIKSIPCKGRVCHEICLRTIRRLQRNFKNNKQKGIKKFIKYASKIYVGSSDRIGQKNWIKNVTWFYEHQIMSVVAYQRQGKDGCRNSQGLNYRLRRRRGLKEADTQRRSRVGNPANGQ
jgi:hypothetical protein